MPSKIIFFVTLTIFLAKQSLALEASTHSKISQQMVINSLLTNYPKILAYYDKVDAAQGSYLASQGFFDIKLKQEYEDKTRGYYDGKGLNSTIEKQNQFLGSKVYAGYRKSFGEFASYDGERLTNHDGEIRAGLRFSLLKDRAIDQNRLGVLLAEFGLKESRVQLETIKIEMQRDAIKAYWRWVAAGKIYEIYQNLLDLALQREKQLEERLKRGDVAEIILVENKKNILRRKNATLEAKRDFENSAIYLSLFLRDNTSNPIIPKQEQLPEIHFSLKEIDSVKMQQDIDKALQNRAEVRIIKIKKDEELSHLKYSENLFLPKFDVEAGASKDMGRGPQSRKQSNNFVKMEFEIPLQFSEARGKISASQSKLSAIRHEEQLLGEQIKNEITQLKNYLHNSIELYHNFEKEAQLAKKLEIAEQEKFKHGASNFFLVNVREQETADAKASQIKMFEYYQENLVAYKAAIFEF
jgi:outer membrane protein TolC